MKSGFLVLSALCVGVFSATIANGAGYDACSIDISANVGRGFIAYKDNCFMPCHNGYGTGFEMRAKSRTMEEWDTYSRNLSELPCSKDWAKGMTEESLTDLFTYLYTGASDAPPPPS